MKSLTKILLIAPFILLVSCEKSSDPDQQDSSYWSPPHSQPGILQVPDRLKSHADPYAQRVYAGVKELEDLITAYHQYFLVPAGTENASRIPDSENRFSFQRDGMGVTYAYFDYLSTSRTFELTVENATGENILLATGDWWADWDAEAGKTQNGKNYGKISYRTPEGTLDQNREFSLTDDGDGRFRVTYQIWRPGDNNGLGEKYEYQFNADKSGSFTYWEYRTNGGGDYIRAKWEANGAGEHILGEGGHAVTNKWQ